MLDRHKLLQINGIYWHWTNNIRGTNMKKSCREGTDKLGVSDNSNYRSAGSCNIIPRIDMHLCSCESRKPKTVFCSKVAVDQGFKLSENGLEM